LAVVAVLVTAAAAARTLFTRIARISVGSRLFGGRSDILTIFFLVQLKEIKKQM
jgi:ABC-type Mn2+/Zn2+ transport system permease subunit